MSFGPRIVEVGPVSIRRNVDNENLDYDLTDYHGNNYSAADKDELRQIRSAINQLLGEEEDER